MAEGSAEAWMDDMAEALAVGRAVGDRVLLVGTSTGGTLAALAMHEPMAEGVAGVAMLSILGLTVNWLITRAEKHFLSWRN